MKINIENAITRALKLIKNDTAGYKYVLSSLLEDLKELKNESQGDNDDCRKALDDFFDTYVFNKNANKSID